jgi:hypothetical protein
MTRRNVALGLAALTIFAGLFHFYRGEPDSQRPSASCRSKYSELERAQE